VKLRIVEFRVSLRSGSCGNQFTWTRTCIYARLSLHIRFCACAERWYPCWGGSCGTVDPTQVSEVQLCAIYIPCDGNGNKVLNLVCSSSVPWQRRYNSVWQMYIDCSAVARSCEGPNGSLYLYLHCAYLLQRFQCLPSAFHPIFISSSVQWQYKKWLKL
jgi:hypothetical protein